MSKVVFYLHSLHGPIITSAYMLMTLGYLTIVFIHTAFFWRNLYVVILIFCVFISCYSPIQNYVLKLISLMSS